MATKITLTLSLEDAENLLALVKRAGDHCTYIPSLGSAAGRFEREYLEVNRNA
jgi:hypothetical protein